ncbi:MAG: hypothetical protein A2481_01165 [Candidatus Yonathbacteria bacterium RIFOXYC2_FULL_47_9]|nr:MAG: hypothetical protein A2481_01165 [Candidatus Yonathbacteria bacterium RIFOXYC2_FULL_47_9]HAT68053.1 hypothetical protein [Candidatus Yonathbacteria bacterium]
MNHFIALLVAFFALTTPAQAVVVYDGYATGPGGLSTPYPAGTPDVYAGLIETVADSGPLLVMFNDYNARTPVGFSSQAMYYTYADVQAGAPVKFTPAQYARAWSILDLLLAGEFSGTRIVDYGSLRGWAEGLPNPPLLLAEINTYVWDIMSTTDCPTMFGGGGSGCGYVDTFDWSNTMYVVKFTGPGGFTDEGLIIRAGQNVAVVPEPKAFWLLASGLLVIGYAVRRKNGLQEARIK